MGSAKILIYSINFAPELTGIGKYNGELVEWLAKQGHQVRVITAPPYYPQWAIKKGYSGSKYQKEDLSPNVQVWRCPIWVPSKVSGVNRLIHLFSFALTSFPILFMQLFWRPHLLFVVEPPLVISPASVLLAKCFRIKTWLHVQDFEVDAAFDLGILPPVFKSFVLTIEQWLMRRFDAVSTISAKMKEKLLKKGVTVNKIRFFPNWVDTQSIYPLDEAAGAYREQFSISKEDVVYLYSGNMGEKQGLEMILEVAERLKQFKHIHFILCGDGAVKERLRSQAEQQGLKQVHFLPLQPIESLNDLLNTADVHLLIQKNNASDLVMPSKLTGMLASGRCIVATANEDTSVAHVMKESNAGVSVQAEQAEQLADAIYSLSKDRAMRAIYGENARLYAVNRLGLESIMHDFLQDVIDLASGKEKVDEGGMNAHG